MIETGQLAPSISLMTDQGQFTLSEHIGKNVIIFFFPKADTSGCTKEAIALFLPFRPNLRLPTPLLSASRKIRPKNRQNSGKSII